MAAAVVTHWSRGRKTDFVVLAVYVGSLILIGVYSHHDVRQQTRAQAYRNCMAIENLKAGQRESAQATIDGDNKLLKDHDVRGVPLPVPRKAVEDDIAAKQKIVDRYPPRECVK